MKKTNGGVMKTNKMGKTTVMLAAISTAAMSALPNVSAASIITFDFTGRLTVVMNGQAVSNYSAATPSDPTGLQTPISASLTYDTDVGVTSSTLSVSMGNWWDSPAVIHNISTTSISGTIIDAQLLGDWN